MRKVLTLFLVCFMLFSVTACSAEKAQPTADNTADTSTYVEINGKKQALIAYNINDNNYFKLRDIANVLKDTEAKFDVIWNDEKQAIELLSNVAYSTDEAISTEKIEDAAPVKSDVVIYFDGGEALLNAYNIADNNYFKLRDVASAIDFDVKWNQEKGIIEIDTTKPYEFPQASGTEFALNTKYLSFKGKTKKYIDNKCNESGTLNNEYGLVMYKDGLMVNYEAIGYTPDEASIADRLFVSLENLFFNCPEQVSAEQIKAIFAETHIVKPEMEDSIMGPVQLVANYCGKELVFDLESGLGKTSYAFLTDNPYTDTQTASSTDSSADYSSVLDEFYNAISSRNFDDSNGKYGLGEAMMEKTSSSEALNAIGYHIEDISGDGTPELLIVDTQYYNMILAVFTIKDSNPTLVFEGWARNSYQLKNDATFYNHASSGASGSCDAIYKLSYDGTQLECVENYFAAPYKNDTGFFKNKTGDTDISNSERLDISYDEYDSIVEDLMSNIRDITVTPFSQYK